MKFKLTIIGQGW